jgi:hypothetical protein
MVVLNPNLGLSKRLEITRLRNNTKAYWDVLSSYAGTTWKDGREV